MPTVVVSRSLLLLPLVLASACEVSGGPGLTTMYSCADGAAVTNPHANNWRMRVGEVRIAYAHDEVDMVIDEQVGIQMVYKGRGKSLYGDHDDNYEGKTSYREVWADRGTQEFYHQYDEVAGDLYSLEALTSSADGRFEIWSDGWIFDNHLFSCYLRSTAEGSAIPSPGISASAIVEARNASHGSTPVPVVLTADDFHCTSASTHQPAQAPVITRLELFFTSEPAFSQVKISPEASTPTSESSCRVDSAYAYDWDIWVQSFEVSRDSLPAGMDPGVQLKASVTPNGQPAQEYLTFGVVSDLRWERGERISFEQPLQFENIACAGNGIAPCGSQLSFDFIAPGGSATFASGCKLTVPLDRIIDSGNRSLDIQHGTNITPEDRYIVTVAPGDGLTCDDDRGLYRTEGATRTALPMQIAFIPRLKTLATAAALDLPGADTGGGGSAQPADGDGDGIPDAGDNCPGVANANQANGDATADNLGDACDDDDDGDAVNDADDNCATAANPQQENADTDATGDACDSDDDGDGDLDGLDNCPLVPNPEQENADQDGLGDACDTPTDPADIDEDGRADEADNCPSTPNGDQANADGDAMGNACDTDDDEDKVADAADNCPTDFNPDQENADTDPTGDACDDDDDGDTVLDSADNCPLDANTDQADTDADGVGDACGGPGGNDNDGDGGDSGGGATDSDGDGIPDDGDNCVFDRNVDQYDSDSDGIGDVCDQAGGGGSTPDTMTDDHSGMSAGCSAGGSAPASGAMMVLLLLAALVLRRR